MKLPAQPIRVMLVDDHQTLLWGLERLVQGQMPRMEVVGCAGSCSEALAKIGRLAPDVVLLDLDLCGESSLGIIPALLSNSLAKILILTAGREQATLDTAVLRGARGVLHKGAPADQVIKAIEKVHGGELWIDHERLGRVFGEMMNPRSAKTRDPERMKLASLTARETNIVHTLVEESGASNKAIAERLFISEHTLRNHLTSIYQKLDVNNRLELYVWAVKYLPVDAEDEAGAANGRGRGTPKPDEPAAAHAFRIGVRPRVF